MGAFVNMFERLGEIIKSTMKINLSVNIQLYNNTLTGEIVESGERYQEGHEGNDEPPVSSFLQRF